MSDYLDRAAEVLRETKVFRASAAFGVPYEAWVDFSRHQADAVDTALGMREERRHGGTTTLNDSAWTRPDKRRWVTEWEKWA